MDAPRSVSMSWTDKLYLVTEGVGSANPCKAVSKLGEATETGRAVHCGHSVSYSRTSSRGQNLSQKASAANRRSQEELTNQRPLTHKTLSFCRSLRPKGAQITAQSSFYARLNWHTSAYLTMRYCELCRMGVAIWSRRLTQTASKALDTSTVTMCGTAGQLAAAFFHSCVKGW